MRTIEDIILEKNYSDLSVEELNLVGELADNEDEFNQMKQLFENMSMEFEHAELFAASSETKASLDQIFTAKHPVIANDWKKEEAAVAEEAKVVAFYNRNWVRVAAIFLLFIGVSILFIKNSDEIQQKETIKQANNVALETKSKVASNLETTATKPEETAIVYPENTENGNTNPVLALAGTPAKNVEWKDSSVDKFAAPTPVDSKVSGEVSSLPLSNGFTGNSYSFTSTSPAASPTLSLSNSGVVYSYSIEKEKDKKDNWGRLADLDPELNMSQPTTASVDYSSSVSKEGLAAEMLDWIQAAY